MEMHVVCRTRALLPPRAYASHVRDCEREGGRACGREKRALTGRRDPRSLYVWSPSFPAWPARARLMQSHFFIFWQCRLSMQWRPCQLAHLLHSGSPPHTTISFLPVDELGNDRTALTVPGMPLNTSSSLPLLPFHAFSCLSLSVHQVVIQLPHENGIAT